MTSATGCAAALDPARSILGSTQEQWLFEQLGTVKATWTVLGQQVPTFARDNKAAAPNGRYSMDKWDGYVASRERLYARLKETKAPNPVVLSGDVHVHYGADLKLDFANPRSRDRRRRVHEHVGHVRRRRRRRERDLGAHPRRQPAHQVPQRPARLHLLHRDADGHAGRLQDPRPGHGARRRRHAPAARSSSKPAARGLRRGRAHRRCSLSRISRRSGAGVPRVSGSSSTLCALDLVSLLFDRP